jgi:hypothetical protein
MNAAQVNELEQDEKPASMIATKNRYSEFFIQKAKLKNLNAITCMKSLGLNYQKFMQFFNDNHKHVEFLRLLHAITMIRYEVKISFQPSDFHFGTIKIYSY